MNVDEILNAISRIRKKKLQQSGENLRKTITPIILSNKSKRTTPLQYRSRSPLSPCVCETSYILPKTRSQLKKFIESHKYHQIMEYKLDATNLMTETIQKYKKRVFFEFSKKIREFSDNEMSFKNLSKPFNSSNLHCKNNGKMLTYSAIVYQKN